MMMPRNTVSPTRAPLSRVRKHDCRGLHPPYGEGRWMCHGTRIKYFFLFANVELVWVHSFIYYRGDVKYFVIYARSNFHPLSG